MINLLRKVRKNLLSKNSFLKYLLYLTGEVVLVIAGILIALNINNSNEARKNEEKIVSILNQVRQELAIDINKTTQLIEYYATKDSLIALVLRNEVTLEDYKNPKNAALFSIVTNVVDLITSDNAYNSLMRTVDNIPEKYNSLIKGLNTVYIDDKTQVDYYNNRMSEFANNILDKWSNKYEWYSKLFTGNTAGEPTEYFANSPFYKNEVLTYNVIAMQNHLTFIKTFRIDAIKSFLAISRALELESDEDFIFDTKQYEKLAGAYSVVNGFEVEISVENGRVYGKGTGQPRFELFPLSDLSFYAQNTQLMVTFLKNSKGNITSFRTLQTGRSRIAQKVD